MLGPLGYIDSGASSAFAGVLLLYILLAAGIGGGIGAAIGSSKGRGIAGFWLGTFLGFIGWIIVAVMEPSDGVRQQRQAETIALATAVSHAAAPYPYPVNQYAPPQGAPALAQPMLGAQSVEPLRSCAVCGETLLARARFCPSCGHEVAPAGPVAVPVALAPEPDPSVIMQAEFPTEYHAARAEMNRLGQAPLHPNAWLWELCRRMAAGAPAAAAAARIPLEWSADNNPAAADRIRELVHAYQLGVYASRRNNGLSVPVTFDRDVATVARPDDAMARVYEAGVAAEGAGPASGASAAVPSPPPAAQSGNEQWWN